jgi:anaerobic selenocysteine-containing dehydrogenase
LLSKDAGSKPLLFVPVSKPNPVAVTEEFPLMLVFGQTLYYWDQNVVVRHSETLRRESRILLLDYPDGFVEINTEDAKRFGIRDGEKIRLWTDGASAVSTARVTPEVRCGSIFVPYFTREVERQIFGAMKNGARYVVPVRVVRETA